MQASDLLLIMRGAEPQQISRFHQTKTEVLSIDTISIDHLLVSPVITMPWGSYCNGDVDAICSIFPMSQRLAVESPPHSPLGTGCCLVAAVVTVLLQYTAASHCTARAVWSVVMRDLLSEALQCHAHPPKWNGYNKCSASERKGGRKSSRPFCCKRNDNSSKQEKQKSKLETIASGRSLARSRDQWDIFLTKQNLLVLKSFHFPLTPVSLSPSTTQPVGTYTLL